LQITILFLTFAGNYLKTGKIGSVTKSGEGESEEASISKAAEVS
jgi:hypothetical protein